MLARYVVLKALRWWNWQSDHLKFNEDRLHLKFKPRQALSILFHSLLLYTTSRNHKISGVYHLPSALQPRLFTEKLAHGSDSVKSAKCCGMNCMPAFSRSQSQTRNTSQSSLAELMVKRGDSVNSKESGRRPWLLRCLALSGNIHLPMTLQPFLGTLAAFSVS
jgi:hypothetical protein